MKLMVEPDKSLVQNQGFWEGLAEEQIRVQECLDCSGIQFYPRILCKSCLSSRLQLKSLPKRGELYSYTIVHRPPSEILNSDLPYILGLVKIKDGENREVQFFSRIVDVIEEELYNGMPLIPLFHKINQAAVLTFTNAEGDR